jgi:cytochrome c-type biogenesis protein CcmH
MRMTLFLVVFAALIGGGVVLLAPPSGAGFSARGASAKALEATLLAPCCFNGTIDTHESEIARSLRTEIETRIHDGETSDAIQADMVERYGRAIVANPHFNALAVASEVMIALMIVAAAALFLRVKVWTKNARENKTMTLIHPTASEAPTDEYDRRLDEELLVMDE